jgi:dTDP-4-amino-4,6-dideoxygalactose transaminase
VDEFAHALESFYAGNGPPKVCAVPVVSGTAALELALRLVGVEPGDVVITQPLSFIATCNAIHNAGAVPAFVDVDPDTLGMRFESLQAFIHDHAKEIDGRLYLNGRRIAACVPVYTLGLPFDIQRIVRQCSLYNIPVVEDSAEALGTLVNGRHAGTFGAAGILSFNGNKIITTGGGGAIITRNKDLAKQARHLSTQAKTKHSYEYIHDRRGFNMRMPALNAALGVAQMTRLNWLAYRKASNCYTMYLPTFQELGLRSLPTKELHRSTWNCWLNGFYVSTIRERNAYLKAFHKQGIQARPLWQPLNTSIPYRDCFSVNTPAAWTAYSTLICVPSGVR